MLINGSLKALSVRQWNRLAEIAIKNCVKTWSRRAKISSFTLEPNCSIICHMFLLLPSSFSGVCDKFQGEAKIVSVEEIEFDPLEKDKKHGCMGTHPAGQVANTATWIGPPQLHHCPLAFQVRRIKFALPWLWSTQNFPSSIMIFLFPLNGPTKKYICVCVYIYIF